MQGIFCDCSHTPMHCQIYHWLVSSPTAHHSQMSSYHNSRKQGLHCKFDIGGIGSCIWRKCCHDIPHQPPVSVSPQILATLFCKVMLTYFQAILTKKKLKNRRILEGIMAMMQFVTPSFHPNWMSNIFFMPKFLHSYTNWLGFTRIISLSRLMHLTLHNAQCNVCLSVVSQEQRATARFILSRCQELVTLMTSLRDKHLQDRLSQARL